jgi:hypothetical protein
MQFVRGLSGWYVGVSVLACSLTEVVVDFVRKERGDLGQHMYMCASASQHVVWSADVVVPSMPTVRHVAGMHFVMLLLAAALYFLPPVLGGLLILRCRCRLCVRLGAAL